jgi:outer membrane protein
VLNQRLCLEDRIKLGTKRNTNHLIADKTMVTLKFRMKNKKAYISIIYVLICTIHLHAQTVISLSEAINRGLENKKQIVAGKLDNSIGELQTKALYRSYYPQLSADYQFRYNPILQTSILPIGMFNPNFPPDATQSVQFGTTWTQSAGLTATQPLLDLSIKRRIDEAKLQERITTLTQEQAEYELAYIIAQTYIDISHQEAKMESAIADTTRTYISYTLLKNRFDEKRLLKSDLNKAQINHNNAVQLLNDAIASLIEHKVYLLYLMGTNDMEQWDFQVDTDFSTKYSISNTLTPTDSWQLPELEQLDLRSQLTDLQAKSERTKRLPTVNLKGFLGANQFSNTFNLTADDSWYGLSYVGLDVKIPLLSGDNIQNKTQQLKLQSQQFNLQKEDKIFQYQKDAITARLKMDNLNTQLKTQEENILLSTESIEIYQLRFKEGQESAANLNLEEATIQGLKADYESNKKQLWDYWLDYLKASGTLSLLWK